MQPDIVRHATGKPGYSRDVMIAAGGLALLAGLFFPHRDARRYLAAAGLGLIASASIPDLIRYIRIETM